MKISDEFKRLLALSEGPAVQLVNAAPSFHENEAVQSIALLGAAMAIAKKHVLVSREDFISAAAIIWDLGAPEFETVTETVQ